MNQSLKKTLRLNFGVTTVDVADREIEAAKSYLLATKHAESNLAGVTTGAVSLTSSGCEVDFEMRWDVPEGITLDAGRAAQEACEHLLVMYNSDRLRAATVVEDSPASGLVEFYSFIRVRVRANSQEDADAIAAGAAQHLGETFSDDDSLVSAIVSGPIRLVLDLRTSNVLTGLCTDGPEVEAVMIDTATRDLDTPECLTDLDGQQVYLEPFQMRSDPALVDKAFAALDALYPVIDAQDDPAADTDVSSPRPL